jgi:hypothetical protein
MANGPIPDGLFVLHRCDNPPCVRPDHLRLGTAKDNTQDMLRKGRSGYPSAPGERNGHARFTDAQVIAIRERFDAGEMIRSLAFEHGVHVSLVSNVVNGRTWRHVGGPIRPRGQIGRRPRKEAA